MPLGRCIGELGERGEERDGIGDLAVVAAPAGLEEPVEGGELRAELDPCAQSRVRACAVTA